MPTFELEIIAQRIASINLNRIGSEGLASQSYSGVSESYLSDLPADILSALKMKRMHRFDYGVRLGVGGFRICNVFRPEYAYVFGGFARA